MKQIFKVDDNWDDNVGVKKFVTKKQKQNSETLKTSKQAKGTENEPKKFLKSKLKMEGNALEEQTTSKISNGANLKTKSKKNKNRKATKKPDEVIFDGECKFTPLLRKNINFENNSAPETVPNEISAPKKKSKKRKIDSSDNGDIIKKPKIIGSRAKLNEHKNDDSLNKNLEANGFANKLRDNLLGGRFRFLNELLYTTTGGKAKEMFEQDKDAFKAYHKGYRQQIEKWPFNPLDRIIKRVRRLPKHMIVADFGCGEAKLADSIPHKCFSIDLISSKPNVIACDMANTPLKSQSIDIVIFCLSLMGTNLNDFICEANRILNKDGIVYVAEIGSRFDNVKDFKKLWEHLGFELLRQDVDKKNYFYFFDFKKIENVKKNVLSVSNCKLKPCIYKRR